MIYLTRHGQTEWNRQKRFNGGTDNPLNQTGTEQGKLLAEKLRGVDFAVCYCSPRLRARQFCEIILGGEFGEVPVKFDERLDEISCGEFEGTKENAESMKSFWRAIQTGDKGTETFSTFTERNCALCDEVSREYGNKDVLIVTHAANARVIDYYFAGKPEGYDFNRRVIGGGEIKTYSTGLLARSS